MPLPRKATVDYAEGPVPSNVAVVAVVAAAGLLVLSSCLGPALPLPRTDTTPAATPTESVEHTARPTRAFAVTRATDLLDGPAAEGRIGDFRLDNDAVAVIVSGPGHAFGFAE